MEFPLVCPSVKVDCEAIPVPPPPPPPPPPDPPPPIFRCVRLCTSLYSLNLNTFPQLTTGQTHVFSSVCVCSCLRKEHFCTNCLPHSLHWNGRSPVCVLTCLVRDQRELNSLSQPLYSQMKMSPASDPVPSDICWRKVTLASWSLVYSEFAHFTLKCGLCVVWTRSFSIPSTQVVQRVFAEKTVSVMCRASRCYGYIRGRRGKVYRDIL